MWNIEKHERSIFIYRLRSKQVYYTDLNEYLTVMPQTRSVINLCTGYHTATVIRYAPWMFYRAWVCVYIIVYAYLFLCTPKTFSRAAYTKKHLLSRSALSSRARSLALREVAMARSGRSSCPPFNKFAVHTHTYTGPGDICILLRFCVRHDAAWRLLWSAWMRMGNIWICLNHICHTTNIYMGKQ